MALPVTSRSAGTDLRRRRQARELRRSARYCFGLCALLAAFVIGNGIYDARQQLEGCRDDFERTGHPSPKQLALCLDRYSVKATLISRFRDADTVRILVILALLGCAFVILAQLRERGIHNSEHCEREL